MEYEKIKKEYEKEGQGHVFKFYDAIQEEEKKKLLDQLKEIKVGQLNSLYQKAISTKPEEEKETKLEPLTSESFESNIGDSDISKKYIELGLDLISKNEVAVILLAGGQGTRLGSSAPKGCYDIGLESRKSLFQLQAERILSLQNHVSKKFNKKDVIIPWYIMTSEPTYENTKGFFEKNNYFGLESKNIIFFNQGTLPCLSKDGKILMESKSSICKAPDGNGGIYEALHRHNIISDMKSRGVKYIHLYCVDNCLVRVADPEFFGFCVSKNADCGAKVVPKSYPEESVGVICLKNGKFQVVEYSELPKNISEELDPNGKLRFRAANICNHYYSLEFLDGMKNSQEILEMHVANKKIKHLDTETGELVNPDKPNGIKLEAFVFDVFPLAKRFVVYEVDRKFEFSPLKNAPGSKTDSPETSKKDLNNLSVHYVDLNGGTVKGGDSLELSPLVSYFGENLEFVKGKSVGGKYYSSLEELKNSLQ